METTKAGKKGEVEQKTEVKDYPERLGYTFLFIGVGVLIFVVILTWLFASGNLTIPSVGSIAEVDSFDLDPIVGLVLVIAMLLIAVSVGKFLIETGSAHIKKAR